MQSFLRTPRIAEAFSFMVQAHKGQMYGNLPYFTHPLQVAEAVINPTHDEIIVALLHDVVEDTKYCEQDIRSSFGKTISDAVALLTEDSNLSYKENINRIIESDSIAAIKVKWADNKINMSGDKTWMTAKRRDRLMSKYAKSFKLLSDRLGY